MAAIGRPPVGPADREGRKAEVAERPLNGCFQQQETCGPSGKKIAPARRPSPHASLGSWQPGRYAARPMEGRSHRAGGPEHSSLWQGNFSGRLLADE